MKRIIKGLFKLITGIAAGLWFISAMALDSNSLMPTVVCAICSGWLVFAVLVLRFD